MNIKNKCKFLWCVLASGSIADRTESGSALKYISKNLLMWGANESKEKFDHNFKESLNGKFEVILFSHVMRNSQSIVNAASPAFYNSYIKNRFHDINMTIKPGDSGTVIGSKPTAIIWKLGLMERVKNIFGYSFKFDYIFFANCILKFTNENIKMTSVEDNRSKNDRTVGMQEKNISVAVLTEGNICAAKLYNAMKNSKKFKTKIYGYGYRVKPSYCQDVQNWLQDGGILVTDSECFNGCEADIVIATSQYFGGVLSNIGSILGILFSCIIMAIIGFYSDGVFVGIVSCILGALIASIINVFIVTIFSTMNVLLIGILVSLLGSYFAAVFVNNLDVLASVLFGFFYQATTAHTICKDIVLAVIGGILCGSFSSALVFCFKNYKEKLPASSLSLIDKILKFLIAGMFTSIPGSAATVFLNDIPLIYFISISLLIGSLAKSNVYLNYDSDDLVDTSGNIAGVLGSVLSAVMCSNAFVGNVIGSTSGAITGSFFANSIISTGGGFISRLSGGIGGCLLGVILGRGIGIFLDVFHNLIWKILYFNIPSGQIGGLFSKLISSSMGIAGGIYGTLRYGNRSGLSPGASVGHRSVLTRAVAKLCIITSDQGVKIDKMKSKINVIEYEYFTGNIESSILIYFIFFLFVDTFF